MYSEKTFKNYIFWIQVKRVFIITLLSVLGAVLGILIGKILESVLQVATYNNYIIAGLTILFFAISVLLTSNTGKEVQDGYWKIAVLRKLTVIQKDIEFNNNLLANGSKSLDEYKNHAQKIEEAVLEEFEIPENAGLIKAENQSKNRNKTNTKRAIKKPEIIA